MSQRSRLLPLIHMPQSCNSKCEMDGISLLPPDYILSDSTLFADRDKPAPAAGNRFY